MPQHVAKKRPSPPPGGGRRVSAVEHQRRLDFAEKLLREAKPRAVIVETIRRTFACSTRAVDSYIAKVRLRWAAESKDAREVERAAALDHLHRLSLKAEKRGAFAAAVSALKLRAQINGLLAPVEVKATVAPARPNPEMTLDDAIAELESIEETLAGARALASRS
jgi:hypothetical protein